MRQASTRELFAYWDKQRGDRLAPGRADIEPVAIRHILGNVFILNLDPAGEHRFRLAGTQVCALFGRELKTQTFPSLWNENSQRAMQYLIEGMVEEKIGAVAGVTGHAAEGVSVDLELLMLPLMAQDGVNMQTLGLFAMTERPYWFDQKPVTSLEIGQLRYVGPAVDEAGGRRFVTGGADVKVRRGLMVYEGGRSSSPSKPPSEKAG